MEWQVIETGPKSPQGLMDLDSRLLDRMNETSRPILHIYEWDSPCLTYGYFIDPYKFLNKKGLEYHGLAMAKRPTGGGIIFHLTDFAFSILLPCTHPEVSLNTLNNYFFINGLVAAAISPLVNISDKIELSSGDSLHSAQDCTSFCMSGPTRYDLIIKGKKVGGAAQRKTKFGLLHQGTISLMVPPCSVLKDVLINHEPILEAMQNNSYSLLGEGRTMKDAEEIRRAIKSLLIKTVN